MRDELRARVHALRLWGLLARFDALTEAQLEWLAEEAVQGWDSRFAR